MPSQKPPVVIPINKGTQPDWNLRLGYPSVKNWFIGKSGSLYPTAGLSLIAAIANSRAAWYTPYGDRLGTFIIVQNEGIYRVNFAGIIAKIAAIEFSGQPVQIDENLQNQVTITDGAKAYVLSQRTNGFQILGEDQGFTFTSPCSVRVLNTYTIIADKQSGSWIVSDPNNALVYPPLNIVPQIQSQLTKMLGLETLNNNLYIIGTTGIERWAPTSGTSIYQFPFARDNNFRLDYGAISYVRGKNVIYLLSSLYMFMALEDNKQYELGSNQEGIAKMISQYPDINKAVCCFYTFRSETFFQTTFPDTGLGWVWNVDSETFTLTDDLILDAADNQEVVLTKEGLYNLSLTPSYKHRQWVGERIKLDKNTDNYRGIHRGIEVELVQGGYQPVEPQRVEYSYSIDGGATWSNQLSKPIGRTGKRQARTRFPLNKACYEFIPRLDYYGSYDFTIEKVKTNID